MCVSVLDLEAWNWGSGGEYGGGSGHSMRRSWTGGMAGSHCPYHCTSPGDAASYLVWHGYVELGLYTLIGSLKGESSERRKC